MNYFLKSYNFLYRHFFIYCIGFRFIIFSIFDLFSIYCIGSWSIIFSIFYSFSIYCVGSRSIIFIIFGQSDTPIVYHFSIYCIGSRCITFIIFGQSETPSALFQWVTINQSDTKSNIDYSYSKKKLITMSLAFNYVWQFYYFW